VHDLQAARGATLSALRLRLVFAAVAAAAYLLDIGTKQLALARLAPGESIRVVGDLLTLYLVRNPGAAFSMGTEATFALSCLAIAAVAAILWVSRRLGSRLWAVALGLLLAGIGGNLTDRLVREPGPMRGHVIDFLRLPHWPVFNVADMLILAGGLLLVLTVVKGVEIDGRVSPDERERAAG